MVIGVTDRVGIAIGVRGEIACRIIAPAFGGAVGIGCSRFLVEAVVRVRASLTS